MDGLAPLDSLPLWLLFLLTVAVVLLSIEAGFRIGRSRTALAEHEKESAVGAISSASLALLAFLLAFTFGFAATRFETRRSVLLDEVNAIGTTYLRSRTLPEPERGLSRALLREYVETRLAAVRGGDLETGIRRSEEIQGRLWEAAAALPERGSGTIFVALYLQSLNEMIDLHTKRVAESLRVRIPPVIWMVLYGVTILSMGELGYQMGLYGRRRPPVVVPFAIAFAAVILLIADLDRYGAGFIRVSQQPMQELLRSMDVPR